MHRIAAVLAFSDHSANTSTDRRSSFALWKLRCCGGPHNHSCPLHSNLCNSVNTGDLAFRMDSTLSCTGCSPCWSILCPRYTTSLARNVHFFLLSRNPASSSLPTTMSGVSMCCAFVAPAKMISSNYTATCGMPCQIFSMVLYNIAGVELMPWGNLLYLNNPLCVFMVTYSFDFSSSGSCE